MLRFVASFFTSNTKPTTTTTSNTLLEDSQETIFRVKNGAFLITEEDEYSKITSEEEEDVDIQSLRQQKLQELTRKALLRKISHQAVMNYYAQDHLPLSQIQEKLKEDDIPLKVLQDKLKQNENLSIYTTIKENINFLLYSKPSKSKKSRPTLSTIFTSKTNVDITNNSNSSTPKDLRDYDVWDDAVIGRLMNLIDTIGEEITQGETSEGTVNESTPKVDNELIDKVVKEVMKEVLEGKSKIGTPKEISIFSKELTDTIEKEDKETIVAESSITAAAVAIENNAVVDIENNAVKDVGNNAAEDVENNVVNNVTKNIENNVVENVENNNMEDIQENIQEKTKRESIRIAEEIINFGETINVAESLLHLKNDGKSSTLTKSIKKENRFRRSIFSLGQFPPSSSNNKNPVPTPKSLKRNVSDLNRRSSIHSKKSYDDDISRRSSVSSKFSVNTTNSVIIEEQNEDGSDNIKFRKRTSSTHKSLRFLKHIWKNNHLANNNEELTSNNERYYKQGDGVRSDHESRRSSVVGPETIGIDGENSNRPDPDYSNFYLSMPNGKWMVRTRTASRKITGTQYVDKEYI